MVTGNTDPEDVGTPAAQPVTPPEGDVQGQPRVFSQEDVNRMQAQTRRETRNQFSDYGELKEKAAKADELEQAQLSGQERLEARAHEAEKRADDAIQREQSALIAAEVKVRASQLGIIDPDAAYLLLDKANVHYSTEGGVTGVDDALAHLLETKSYLRGPATRAPNLNPQSGEPAPTLRLSEGQREAARLMGMTEEDYALGL